MLLGVSIIDQLKFWLIKIPSSIDAASFYRFTLVASATLRYPQIVPAEAAFFASFLRLELSLFCIPVALWMYAVYVYGRSWDGDASVWGLNF